MSTALRVRIARKNSNLVNNRAHSASRLRAKNRWALDNAAEKKKVFISYASADRETAERVTKTLEDAGFSCWLDKSRIGGGEFFADEILSGIDRSNVVVLLVSEKFAESPHTRKELVLAVDARIAVLPILIEDFLPEGHLRYFLCDCQWLDAHAGEISEHAEQLLRSIEALTGEDSARRSARGVTVGGVDIPGLVDATDMGIRTPGPYLDLQLPKSRIEELNQPSQWLQAHNRLIPLLGRETELADMSAFLDSEGTFLWRAFSGDGGVGKTRFILEVATDASARGWQAGFVDKSQLSRFVSASDADRWRPMLPTLIVVDYAASKTEELSELLELLAKLELSNGADHPIRLVLLERHADEQRGWMRDLLSTGERDIADALRNVCYAGISELSPPVTAGEQEERLSAVQQIVEHTFAAWERITGKPAPTLPDFSDSDWGQFRLTTGGRPLYVQLAAIHACESSTADGLTLWGRGELLDAAVQRERAYVARECRDADLKDAVEWAAAILCLTGASLATSRQREWFRILSDELAALGLSRLQPRDVDERRKAIFFRGAVREDGETSLIQPDIVSEGFVGTILNARDEPPEASLQQIIAWAGVRAWGNTIRMVQDLNGLKGFESVSDWLSKLIDVRPVEELEQVARLIPERTACLHGFGIRINEEIVKRSETREPFARATALLELASHRTRLITIQAEAVDEEAQLARAENELSEAIELLEELVRDEPERAHVLSRAYRRMSSVQDENRNYPGSAFFNLKGIFVAIGDASPDSTANDARDRCYSLGPIEFPEDTQSLYELSDNLNLLSIAVRRIHSSILESSMHAVAEQEQSQPAADTHLLEAATEASRLAVAAGELLVKASWKLYAGDLSRYLNNLAQCEQLLGELDDALIHCQRSTEIREKLMWDNPDEYVLPMLLSLETLYSLHAQKKDTEAALLAAEKYFVVIGELSERTPEQMTEQGRNAHRVAAMFEESGNHERAKAAMGRSVRYLSLSFKQETPGSPRFVAAACDLAASLTLYGDWCARPKELSEAARICRLAIDNFGDNVRNQIWGALHENLGHALVARSKLDNDDALIAEGTSALDSAVECFLGIGLEQAAAQTAGLKAELLARP